MATPPSLEKRVRGVEVGGKPLHLMFRAKEGVVVAEQEWEECAFQAREVVVGANPLRHSNSEWEGGGAGQETPPIRVSSEGGGGGHESPLSLE